MSRKKEMSDKEKTIEENVRDFNLEETEEFLKSGINRLELHAGNRAIKEVIIKLIGEIKEIKKLNQNKDENTKYPT